MDNIKKTSLDEARASFEQIKKFATEAVKKEYENEINAKVEKILEESLSVKIDDEGNTTVTKDNKVIEMANDGEIEIENLNSQDGTISNNEEHFEDEDEEIKIDKNIDEMITFEQERQVPETAPVDASETPIDSTTTPMETETPVEKPAINPDVLELAQVLDKLINNKIEGTEEESENQGVDYIDDDATSAQASAPAAPSPIPAPTTETQPAPVQEEDELLEFNLDEINECGLKEENMLEFEDLNDDDDYIEFDDEDPEAMLTAIGDISREKPDWKKDVNNFLKDESELDEMKGLNKVLRNTSNRLGLEPREGTPNLQESKIKAQYESKIDELRKENKRLNESVKEYGEVVKNYQESFVGLRKQFDEMQTFNAKLAYANKLFANGGLSTAEKTKIAEEFDKTQTADEAKKLYNKILEENKIIVNKDNISKIKAPTTNTVKGKDVVFESYEMRRSKELAGITKNENYN